MVKQLYRSELKDIGQGIIEESEKGIPDVIGLKAQIDDLTMLIELIKRESKKENAFHKIMS